MPFLSVVVPCRDEEANVLRFPAELFPALDALGISYEVVAVNDGSRDGTSTSLLALAKDFPLTVVDHGSPRGLGAALRSGFARAAGEWIATLDADLTFHPVYLASLLYHQRETGADLVAAHPVFEGVPWRRRWPSQAINFAYRRLLGGSLSAYTPIFRLYRAEVLKSLALRAEGFEINAEIAAGFLRAGRRLSEVAVPLTARVDGASKLSAWPELRRHGKLLRRLLVS